MRSSAKRHNLVHQLGLPSSPAPRFNPPGFLFSDDTDVGLHINAHVDKVRAIFERMDHTFNMARARSDLRATINGLRQNIATCTTSCEREENTCPSGDVGNITIGRKEASSRYQNLGRKTEVA